MTNHEDGLIEALRTGPNPFDSAIVRNLWTDPPDVRTINRQASDAILGDLQRVLTTGESWGVVIQGAAGLGKTHLLSRLRRNKLLQANTFLVDIPPLVGRPDEFMRHILYHMVVSLQQTIEGGMPQIRRLFVNFAKERVEGLERGQLHVSREELKRITREGRHILLQEAPSADADAVRAFGAFIEGHEDIACDWLRGQSLDEDDLSSLGLHHSVQGEDHALRIIEALTTMAALGTPRRIMVFCFDQIDSYSQSGRLRRYAEMVTMLTHQRNHLVISLCLADTWEEIRNSVEPPLVQRMSMSPEAYSLTGLGKEQIEALLAARLDAAFPDVARPTLTYPFSTADIQNLGELAPGRVPSRLVLHHARGLFEEHRTAGVVQPAQPSRDLADVIRERLAAATDDAPPPDTIQTRALARHTLSKVATVRDPDYADEDAMDFVVEGAARLGLVFASESDARKLRHRFDKAIAAASTGRVDRIVVVRDQRAELRKTAPMTRELLERIESGPSMCLYLLQPLELSMLVIVRELEDKAIAGDLTYEENGQLRIATSEQVDEQIRKQGLLSEFSLVQFMMTLLPSGEESGPPTPQRNRNGKRKTLETGDATPAITPGIDQELADQVLVYLDQHPVSNLERITAALEPAPTEESLRDSLDSLRNRGCVQLHEFQSELQVRRV